MIQGPQTKPDPFSLHITNLDSNIHSRCNLSFISTENQNIYAPPDINTFKRPVNLAGICYQRNIKIPISIHDICKQKRAQNNHRYNDNNYNVIFRTGGSIGQTKNYQNIGIASCEAIILDNINKYNTANKMDGYIMDLSPLPSPKYGHELVYSKRYGLLAIGGDPVETSRDVLCLAFNSKSEKDDYDPDSHVLESVKRSVEPDYQIDFDLSSDGALVKGVLSDDDDSYESKSGTNTESSWKQLTSLPQHGRLKTMGCVIQNGYKERGVMVFGGRQKLTSRSLNTCMFHDFDDGKWTDLASFGIGVDALGKYYDINGGRIYMCGFKLGQDYKAVNICQYYDIKKDKWYSLPNTMVQHSKQPEMWINQDDPKMLYVADIVGNMEVLDLRTNQWRYTNGFIEQFGIQKQYGAHYKLLK